MRAFHEVRSYNSDFMVWHSSYDNISFLAHWHKEIELIYVRSGTCHLSITDVNFTAHAGDLAICESGAIHYSDSHNMDNSLDFIIFDTSIISPIFQNPHFINPLVTKEELEQYGLSAALNTLISAVSRELEKALLPGGYRLLPADLLGSSEALPSQDGFRSDSREPPESYAHAAAGTIILHRDPLCR